MNRGTVQMVAAAAFAVCFVATFLPWAKAGEIYSESGLESAGVVALVFAAIGCFCILSAKSASGALIAAACALALIGVGVMGVLEVRDGIEELGELNDLLGAFEQEAKVGVGLYLLIASAAVALGASLAQAAAPKSGDKAVSLSE